MARKSKNTLPIELRPTVLIPGVDKLNITGLEHTESLYVQGDNGWVEVPGPVRVMLDDGKSFINIPGSEDKPRLTRPVIGEIITRMQSEIINPED